MSDVARDECGHDGGQVGILGEKEIEDGARPHNGSGWHGGTNRDFERGFSGRGIGPLGPGGFELGRVEELTVVNGVQKSSVGEHINTAADTQGQPVSPGHVLDGIALATVQSEDLGIIREHFGGAQFFELEASHMHWSKQFGVDGFEVIVEPANR